MKPKKNNYTKLTKNNNKYIAINEKENSNILSNNSNISINLLNSLNQDIKINDIENDSSFLITESNNISNNQKDNKDNNDNNDKEDQITQKIDYKHYTNYPIENLIRNSNKYNYEKIDKSQNSTKICWLAAYDKYIKKKNLLKIFNFYNMSLELEPTFFDNIKMSVEKTLIIKDYQLIYMSNYNKIFIIPSKGNQIFVKLYLLNIEQMNMIFSYINRIEYKPYLNNLLYNNKHNCYEIVNDEIKIGLTYSAVNCLGSYMNIDIYAFSSLNHLKKYKNKICFIKNNNNIDEDDNNLNDDNNLFPSTKKLAKLIKILMINFPDYSKEYLLNYLINSFSSKNEKSDNKDNSKISEKILEVKNLLMSKRKSLYQTNDFININNTNQIIKNIITSIPTNSISSIETNNNQNGANISCSEFISDSKCNINGNSQKNKNSQKSIKNNNFIISYCEKSSMQKNDIFYNINNTMNSINNFIVSSKAKEKSTISKMNNNKLSVDKNINNNNGALSENILNKNIRKSNGLTLKHGKDLNMNSAVLPVKCKIKTKLNNNSYIKELIKKEKKIFETYTSRNVTGKAKMINNEKENKFIKNKNKFNLSMKNKKITRNSYIYNNTNILFQDINKDDIDKKYETINTENNVKEKSNPVYQNKIPKINKLKKNVVTKRNKKNIDKNNILLIDKNIFKNKNESKDENKKPFEKPKKYDLFNIDVIRASLNYSVQKTGSTKNSITSLNKKGKYETPTRIKNFKYYN